MKGNTNKSHLLLSKDESSEIHIGGSIIESSSSEKYLALKLIQNFALTTIFKIYAKRANKKLPALALAFPSMNLQKKKIFNECLFQRTVQLLSVDLDAL